MLPPPTVSDSAGPPARGPLAPPPPPMSVPAGERAIRQRARQALGHRLAEVLAAPAPLGLRAPALMELSLLVAARGELAAWPGESGLLAEARAEAAYAQLDLVADLKSGGVARARRLLGHLREQLALAEGLGAPQAKALKAAYGQVRTQLDDPGREPPWREMAQLSARLLRALGAADQGRVPSLLEDLLLEDQP